MSYGAFVKLEPGIEGLVHISEMSWTKRINHPSELVQIGDKIEVQVLNINQDKQEISLGMKQVQPNPWDKVAEQYPPGTIVTGIVRNLTNYGAFIEIEEGIDGLLHVSDMSWVRKVAHPSEVVQKGEKVTCIVLNVDQERKRIALGLKQMANDPWEGDIPGRYKPGRGQEGQGHQAHQLRRLRRAGAGPGRPAAHLRAGRRQGREPRGRRQGRRRDRGQGAARRCQGPQDRPEPQATWTTPSVPEDEAGRPPTARGRDGRRTATAEPKRERELRGGTGGGGGQLIQHARGRREEVTPSSGWRRRPVAEPASCGVLDGSRAATPLSADRCNWSTCPTVRHSRREPSKLAVLYRPAQVCARSDCARPDVSTRAGCTIWSVAVPSRPVAATRPTRFARRPRSRAGPTRGS